MVMNIDENFDADSILREPDDYEFFDEETEEEDVPELELGNTNRIPDLDMSEEDEEALI